MGQKWVKKVLLPMAFVTDSNRPQPLWQPPPTACLRVCGAASEVLSLLIHPCWGATWGIYRSAKAVRLPLHVAAGPSVARMRRRLHSPGPGPCSGASNGGGRITYRSRGTAMVAALRHLPGQQKSLVRACNGPLPSGRLILYRGGGGSQKIMCTPNRPPTSGPFNDFHFFQRKMFLMWVGGWVRRSQDPLPPPPRRSITQQRPGAQTNCQLPEQGGG